MSKLFDTDPFSGLDKLDAPTRLKLADYLEARNKYYMHSGEVNRRRIALIHNPDPDAQQDLEEYASVMLSPARDEMSRLRMELLEIAVDLTELKSILPMIIAVVTRSINLPLLLTVADVDPDMINKGLELLGDYLGSGMPD